MRSQVHRYRCTIDAPRVSMYPAPTPRIPSGIYRSTEIHRGRVLSGPNDHTPRVVSQTKSEVSRMR